MCNSKMRKKEYIEDEQSYFSALFLHYVQQRIDTPDVVPFFFSDRAYDIFMDLPQSEKQAAIRYVYKNVVPPVSKPMRVYTRVFMEYLEGRHHLDAKKKNREATSHYGRSTPTDPSNEKGNKTTTTASSKASTDDWYYGPPTKSSPEDGEINETTTRHGLDHCNKNSTDDDLEAKNNNTATVQDSHSSVVSPAPPSSNEKGHSMDSPNTLKEESNEPSSVQPDHDNDLKARLEMTLYDCDNLRRETARLRERNEEWDAQQESLVALQDRAQWLEEHHATFLDTHRSMTNKCTATYQDVHKLQQAKRQLEDALDSVRDQTEAQDVEIQKLHAEIARLRQSVAQQSTKHQKVECPASPENTKRPKVEGPASPENTKRQKIKVPASPDGVFSDDSESEASSGWKGYCSIS